MRGVVQRVNWARVKVGGDTVGEIGDGVLLLLSVGVGDAESDADYLARKVLKLRIFRDSEGRMNRSVTETGGGMLIVSQFTLHGDVRKGMRPSFINAAEPSAARTLYEYFVDAVKKELPRVATGRFQAMMDVESCNDGPVTILLDSKKEF